MTTPHDRPDRYDLSDPNSEGDSPAEMKPHHQGDYVTFGEYETLLEAYRDLCERVKDVAGYLP